MKVYDSLTEKREKIIGDSDSIDHSHFSEPSHTNKSLGKLLAIISGIFMTLTYKILPFVPIFKTQSLFWNTMKTLTSCSFSYINCNKIKGAFF